MAELWDLYTKDRVKTDRQIERGTKLPLGLYHLSVLVALFNEDGKMLIQKRAATTTKWAGYYDLSAGGSAVAGDSSGMAAERELYEELGIKYSLADTIPNMTIPCIECFVDIYLVNLRTEEEPELSSLTLQPEEVELVRWADKEEIFSMIRSGEFIPYNEGIIEALFFLRSHRGLKREKYTIY